MWLQRSVMFPSLHANIRTILNSPDTTIVQFVLEPLAFPDILADYLSHGIHFAHLLSYLTRTFAFSMHRDYQRIVNDPPHHQVACKQLNNASYFSVSGDDVDHHPSVLSIAVAECVGPSLAVPVVAPQEDRNPILPQVHCTAMSAIAFSTNCSPATSPDSDALIEPYLKTNREHLNRAVCRVEVSAELPRLPITDCAHDWRGGNGDVVYGLDSVTRCQQPML